MSAPLRRRPHAWRLRWHLALLSAALLAPMLAVLAVFGLTGAQAEHARLLVQAGDRARHIVADLDAMVGAHHTLLSGLAAAYPEDNLDALRRSLLAAGAASGLALAVHGDDGVSLGPRDDAGCPAAGHVAPASGIPRVTGLLRCEDGSEPFVLAVGALGEAGLISARIPVSRLREPLLRADDGSAQQGAALADADGIILARWRDHDRFVGQPMPMAARAAIDTPTGVWEGRNLAGEPVLVAHATSALTGWMVGFGVRREALAQPLREALLGVAPVAAGLTGFAVLATFLLARRIEGSVADLATAAATLGDGGIPAAPRGRIAEVDSVAAVLAAAAQAQREAEARRQLMLQEMQHRVKNMLATVQSIATLSARDATDAREFARGFGLRLRAMADTHALLMASGAPGAPLERLVARELAPYARHDGAPRTRWGGPPVMLPADAAIAVGLALHELATNAAKHGALSRDEGRVSVTWRTVAAEGTPRLEIEWVETGGPAVAGLPAARGFGSRLLAQVLGGRLGGGTTLDWRPEGLRARIECRLDPIQPDAEPPGAPPLPLSAPAGGAA